MEKFKRPRKIRFENLIGVRFRIDPLGYKQFPKAYETIVKCSKI
jgi:hypothetical protein